MATSRLAGTADAAAWSDDPHRARRIGLEAAGLLSDLHNIPLESIPPSASRVPGTVGNSPAEQVEHLYEFWQEKRLHPNPLMEGCFGWLKEHAPREFSHKCIVHADFGFHNLLVSGSSITGVLDWESAHIGDAHEDLAYARQFIQKVMPWQDFVDRYVEGSGLRYDSQVEKFFNVFGILRLTASCFSIVNAVESGNPYIDSKLSYVGWRFAHRFLIDAALAVNQ
jgi:aminoglycoside phosphotransferase (APT) family kinase protein